MKVYSVGLWCGEVVGIKAIFSTRERADIYAKGFRREDVRDFVDVAEWEVDVHAEPERLSRIEGKVKALADEVVALRAILGKAEVAMVPLPCQAADPDTGKKCKYLAALGLAYCYQHLPKESQP
jgi:hypothetical protein